MVTVCTVLPPPERPRLDAAGDGCFTTVHTSSFRDALRAAPRRLAPAAGPGRPSGVPRRGPDSSAPRPRARRGDGGRTRILRGGCTARAGTVHGAAAGAAPPDLLEYAHVPLLSGGPAVPEDLPRRYAARARGLPVLEPRALGGRQARPIEAGHERTRSEEHTSELQSQSNLVCRLLLEKKK